ncbi:FAD-containing oxidoreductase [Prosthecomicrobium pneumaticum]|uniref:Pyruvate/2-oxoglutarate dehydrogenase complex dihydrolipoamide dehydrogenase (E3) component n=1 Tax=Prosthecomicrobium pneumaticum TaxID=81895 RepID=A0A7W9L3E2_9HYPH|nr:FAD-containing oxidoreductase [Prosthecomicrobium pneumaticum]MBB5754463.1 pyruvate/2-oxoglutarate dehydrogenase complex dihydrolipoamide dehydrogenase (E3) component [Prosthecomicrobium pneumaticum]
MAAERFDAIVVGAGQAGPFLAARLEGAGMKVALVEREALGGTCVNTGCTPTKTLVASAYAAHLARRAAEYGVTIGGPVGIDIKAVMARKDGIVAKSRGGLESWLGGLAGLSILSGHARFVSPTEIRVGERLLTAPQIFLNTGGRAAIPDFPGVGEIDYLTNTSILALDTVPRHLVVIGGSYIGLEFAQIFRRFGAEVTVVEKGPRLVAREDPEISEAIRGFLEKEGIRVRTGAECIAFARRADGIGVSVSCTAGAPEEIGSHVLLAVGRKPNTDDLGLEHAGIETDARGFIPVDDQLRTRVPGIFALGDCNGRGAFTHTSYNDFEIVAANLLDGASRRVSDRIPVYALYTDPPLGRVGMTEAEAKRTGRPILVGRRPMTRVNRAVEKGESEGLMKVVVDAETKAVLGAAILGVGGDEVVHGPIDTMYAGAPSTTVQHAVHIHPTVSELIPTLLSELAPAD